jgi:hypothetical protein
MALNKDIGILRDMTLLSLAMRAGRGSFLLIKSGRT